MRTENLSRFYVLEGGRYALYTFEGSQQIRHETGDRLAIAYDSDELRFYFVGDVSEVMRHASEKRAHLRAEGKAAVAKKLAVVMLPRHYDVDEVNRLLTDSSYITRFLQKAGLV